MKRLHYEFEWINEQGDRIPMDTKVRPRNDQEAITAAQERADAMWNPVYVRRVEYLVTDSLGIELPLLPEVTA